MKKDLQELLSHLAATLDPERERQIAARHAGALRYEPVDRPPVVAMYPSPTDSPWQPFPHRETIADPEKMLFNELVSAWNTSIVHRAQVGDDLPATIRANFGTVLVASMFGARVEQHEDNPPWIVHRAGHTISLEQVADTDPTDFSQGWIPRAAERMQAYHDLLESVPGLREQVQIVLPDLQGPFDNLELICGSETFLHLATDPELVSAALTTLATAQVGLARYFAQWTTERDPGISHQHGFSVAGHILLRGDSFIMLSPQMYRELIAPHDETVLQALGGGGVHSCGNFMHQVDGLLELPSLRCLDFGQSYLNDVDAVYARARERGVGLTRVYATREELTSGAIGRRFPTGVTFLFEAASLDEAREVLAAYRQQCGEDSLASFPAPCDQVLDRTDEKSAGG